MIAIDFGFLFARVMHFYGLSDLDLLAMPVRRFWLLNKSVDRIVAEQAIQSAVIAVQTQSGDSFSDLMKGLRKQMGQVVVLDRARKGVAEKLDREGLDKLRLLGKIR